MPILVASGTTGTGSDAGISAAVIAAIASIVVAVISGLVSYRQAVRQSREDLRNRLQETAAQGQQQRETAKRQYELEAIKRFRENVGPPKGQIIEAVHDLSERLTTLFSNPQAKAWTSRHEYFQQTFLLLVLRPFTWRELLRRRTTYLDQSLGELLDDEFNFLEDCDRLQRSLTDATAFAGTGYDDSHSSAHVFAGTLREAAEDLIVSAPDGEVCISATAFRSQLAELRTHECIAEIEPLLSNLDQVDRATTYKLARLLIVYHACCTFLLTWKLPFRRVHSPESALTFLPEIREGDLQTAIERYLVPPKPKRVEAEISPVNPGRAS